jgi:surface antigen
LRLPVFLTIAAVVLAIAVAASGGEAATRTATATLYLTPAQVAGSTVTAKVFEQVTGDKTNAVAVKLTYSKTTLAFQSATVASQTWGVVAANTGGNGLADIEVGTTTPVTGVQLVATLAFHLTATGPRSIAISSGSAVISSSTNRPIPLVPHRTIAYYSSSSSPKGSLLRAHGVSPLFARDSGHFQSVTVGATTYPYQGAPGVNVTCDQTDFSCDGGGYVGQSVPGYGPGHNCTTYADFRETQNIQNTGTQFPTTLGNAKDWANNASGLGIPVDHTSVAGDIAQWGPDPAHGDPLGHVAYIESVDPNGTLHLTDDNFPSGSHPAGHSRALTIATGSTAWPDYFIHFQAWAARGHIVQSGGASYLVGPNDLLRRHIPTTAAWACLKDTGFSPINVSQATFNVLQDSGSSVTCADLNHDQVVSVIDLSIMLSHFNQAVTTYTLGDLNADNVVNIFDLSILLSHFAQRF